MRNQPCKELGERIFWVVGTVSAKGKSRNEFGGGVKNRKEATASGTWCAGSSLEPG